MSRARLSKLNLRILFVRNLLVAVLIVVAFAIGWITIPARAGLDSIASGSTALSISPDEIVVQRTAIVDPTTLPPPMIATRPVSRPLRMRDPIGYRKRKAALASGAIMPGVPSMLSLPLATTPTLLNNFAGMATQESCGRCEPPDTQVAAGPNHVFEVDNVAGKIFDKSGNVLVTTFNINSLFNLSAGLFTSDPRIEYDTISDRWFISILSLDSGNPSMAHNGQFNLAVSTSSDPTQLFNVYTFATPGSFPDQPSLGFNDDKVVSSGNSFSCDPNCGDQSAPFFGNEVVVWNKSELLAGATNVHTDFIAPPADFNDLPIIPAKSRSSTSTLYMASALDTNLTLWSLTGVPGVGSGTSVATTDLKINFLADPPGAKQQGSTNLIATGDARLQDAVFRDGKFWTSATSACTPAGDSDARSCMRYIEVLTDSLTINQDFDFGSNRAYDYYPSVDLDSSDNLITSFSQSSSIEFASAFIGSRLDGDPVNTLGTPVLFKAGLAAYKGTRWGDYSGAGIDPADESVIWLAAEYSAPGINPNWGTWIAEARAAGGPPQPPFGRLRVATNHLNFGNVKVNSSASLPLKIQNKGKFDLQVTIGTLVSPFSVNGSGTLNIPKGKSKTATVTFQPLATGAAAQTLSVTSDDPKNPAKNVKVSGTGK